MEQNRRVARRCRIAGRGAAEGEDSLILEKELTLFRKEQTEPGEVDLLLVGFDLREIGVVGEVGGQVPGNAVFHVEPDVTGDVVGNPGRGDAIGRQARDGVRLDFEAL